MATLVGGNASLDSSTRLHGLTPCRKKEHGLTEDGKTVAPFAGISVSNPRRPRQPKYSVFRSFLQTCLAHAIIKAISFSDNNRCRNRTDRD